MLIAVSENWSVDESYIGIGIGVEVGMSVGVLVEVGVGVIVGPNNCPGPQPVRKKLSAIKITNTILNLIVNSSYAVTGIPGDSCVT